MPLEVAREEASGRRYRVALSVCTKEASSCSSFASAMPKPTEQGIREALQGGVFVK
jgi:hypothetical protein